MDLTDRIRANIERVLVGKREQIDLLLCALLAGRHVLLEDVPGTGKTMLARALARSVDGAFRRIQFTPDLLPGDVTGQMIYRPATGDFAFERGPIFANIVLADEINRATPRSQSALLECMEEGQVTVGGETRKLDVPFLVIATQNPVEMQGTFPLPEAQLDRFFLCLAMGYTTREQSIDLLRRNAQRQPIESLEPVANIADIIAAQRLVEDVRASDAVLSYIAGLCERTRGMEDVAMGASPRAMIALLRAAQAWALLADRAFVVPEDVQRMASPVLAHRLLLTTAFGGMDKARAVIAEAVAQEPVPTEEIAP